jgi:hypothetical protein
MSSLLGPALVIIVGVEVAGVDRFAECFERRESVLYLRPPELRRQARFVPFDCESEDMVFVRCDAGFAEQEVVSEEEGEGGC